jgi:oligopeptide/dipeptide ABC transporter ATP-binding protein
MVAAFERARLASDVGSRYPHELSSGTQQKVALARALACSPKLVLLDEPTSAIDILARHELLDILDQLKRDEGLSMLFITHDLTAVRRIAERVAVMYLGRVVETGSTAEIFENPRHPYTRALLSAVPSPDPQHKRQRIRLKGEIPSPTNLPSACYLCGRCPREIPACSEGRPELGPVQGDRLVACIREQPESPHFAPAEMDAVA